MPTFNQLIRYGREEKRRTDRTRASDQCPQKQGVCPRLSTFYTNLKVDEKFPAIVTTTCVSFSSILSLIALACTTCYWNLPDVICLLLFCSLYWLFLYLSLYISIRWGVFKTRIKRRWHKIKAACTHQSYFVFVLNILNIVFCYALIYLSYLVLKGEKETFVKILLIMSECSSIYFCFCSQTELSRFQAVYSFFLSYLLNIFILEKLAVSVFFYLFLLFLVVEFLLVKYKGFFPLNFSFFVILIAFLLISPEIRLWLFNLVVQLVFLYLLQFILHKFSHIDSSPSLFFSLLFLLLSLLVIEDFDFRDTDFQLKIIFLGAGSLVLYFCFLSKTGWELVITTLSYIILNLIIGGFIAYEGSVFLHSSIFYLILNLFIFFNIYFASIKKDESLTSIFNQIKVRVVLGKLAFLLVILKFLKEDFTYSWIWPWLATFTLQIIGLNLFFFFFDKKEDEFFQTLGRKQTIFLSRLIIYGSALLFFLLLPLY